MGNFMKFPIFIDDFPRKKTTFFLVDFPASGRGDPSDRCAVDRFCDFYGIEEDHHGYSLGKTYENIIKHLIDVENPAGFPRKSSNVV
jgi:hypothetical protein